MTEAAGQRYRLVALDVDGTIARKDYTVPGEVIDAIGDAMASGAVVSLVTGRIRASALRYADICRTNGPTASHQGAIITVPGGETDLHSERLSASTARTALNRIRETGSEAIVFAEDEIWVEAETEWSSGYAERMQKKLRMDRSLDEIAGIGPVVVMAVDDPQQIADLAERLRSEIGSVAAVTHSLPHFCEVTSARATKAHALERISSDLGIHASEVIAVGDGEGDLSMIQWAGLGVAAGDAHPQVRAVADVSVAGPEEYGVAKLLQSLLQQGKLGG